MWYFKFDVREETPDGPRFSTVTQTVKTDNYEDALESAFDEDINQGREITYEFIDKWFEYV